MWTSIVSFIMPYITKYTLPVISAICVILFLTVGYLYSDSASLATGKGYKLGITASFTDNNMAITISSITRVSEAIDPF